MKEEEVPLNNVLTRGYGFKSCVSEGHGSSEPSQHHIPADMTLQQKGTIPEEKTRSETEPGCPAWKKCL